MRRRYSLRNAILFLVLFAFAAILSGCSLFDGYAVEDYLKEVGRIQYDSDASLQNLDQHLESLGGDLKIVEETVSLLKTDRDAVAAARTELEALEAPEAAATFKDHLLELYTEGDTLLEELIKTGEYRIKFEPLMIEYETSSNSFSENIKAVSEQTELINDLRAYESSIAVIIEKTQVIKPPILSASSHKRFVANLNTMKEGLSQTIAGLESEDAAAIEAAANKMAKAAEIDEPLRLQINAEREEDIRSYNMKVQRMSELWNQVGQDQLELRERFSVN